jgi:hypothetical protein
MSTVFDPVTTPVDSITLGGLGSPGIAKIVGADRKRKVDIRGGYGISSTVAVWLEVAEFKVEIYLYSYADWGAWYTFRDAVLKELQPNTKQGAAAYALDIWHPWLEAQDIKSVILKSISQPEEVEQTVYRITLEFIEYRKASLSLSKPEKSKEQPKDKLDQLIDANNSEIQRRNQRLRDLDGTRGTVPTWIQNMANEMAE